MEDVLYCEQRKVYNIMVAVVSRMDCWLKVYNMDLDLGQRRWYTGRIKENHLSRECEWEMCFRLWEVKTDELET